MATVTVARISTGELPPHTRGKDVSRDEWKYLLSARRSYCNRQFQHDCQELLFYIDDGRENNFFGYPDEVTYWREGLSLEPEAVPFAERYLRVRKARLEAGIDGRDWREISFDDAVASQRIKEAARVTTGDVLPRHVHPDGQFAYQSQANRATESGISQRTQRNLDALARKRPDLLDEVRAGRMSTNRACIEAGIVTPPTPFQQIKRLIPKLNQNERMEIIKLLK